MMESGAVGALSRRQVARLSVKWSWVSRASAYDDCLEQQRRSANEKVMAQMNERQATLAMAAQSKLVESLNSIQWQSLRPSEFARVMEVATKVERLARGAETDNVKHTGDEIDRMTPEERQAAMVDELVRLGKTEVEANEIVRQMVSE
jgi:hypothetical protein